MKKSRYTIKKISKEASQKQLSEIEHAIQELGPLLPTLKKHGIEERVRTEIKTLRSGRKSRAVVLELTREFPYIETKDVEQPDGSIKTEIIKHRMLKASGVVEKEQSKFAVVRSLKENIINQVRAARKDMLPKPEEYHFNHGLVVPKLDAVYLEKGSFLKAFLKKVRVDMSNTKKPNDAKARYVGVEIELAAVENRTQLCDAIFAAGIGKHIGVKDDGSIGSANRDGAPASKLKEKFPHTHEITVLAKENEIEEVITKLCNVLNSVLHTAIDKTCGLHVHFDMRSRDVKVAFNNLVLSQQFLYAMLPAQRRNSGYARPTRGAEMKERGNDRYQGVNSEAYYKYHTLELRMHCGTTNGSKINNWIKLGKAICDAPKFKAAPTNIDSFRKTAELSDDLVRYVETRIATFADQHKKNVPSAEEPGTMPNIEEVIGMIDNSQVEPSEVA